MENKIPKAKFLINFFSNFPVNGQGADMLEGHEYDWLLCLHKIVNTKFSSQQVIVEDAFYNIDRRRSHSNHCTDDKQSINIIFQIIWWAI